MSQPPLSSPATPATPAVVPEVVTRPRRVERLVAGQPTTDGAGVKLDRVLTQVMQQRLDPFLMLDAFRSDDPNDWIAGFPDHPHRGFETVTYMIAGRMRHRDSAGNEGLLEGGGVQWMTAGRGVIHSELPEQTEGLMEGFQLWLNLPARDKMRPPWYRDFTAPELPSFVSAAGVRAVVIAGTSHGVRGAVQREGTEPLYLDLALPAGARFEHAVPDSHNAFVYVYRGSIEIEGTTVPAGRMAVFSNQAGADGIAMRALGEARVLLIAGRPLREPIVQYGPFVMNTVDEIRTAVADFQAGRLA
ncbi:MAG: pirin family protein [Burkholderiaceae bacterium]|jgi:redox-sensitive bicupin YhaK (pirin superfamily)